MAGGRIDIEVNADTSGVAGQLQRGLGGAVGVAGNFGKIMGAGILAGGVVSAFGEVIKTGNDFTNELNTMQAVSSATADQMAAVSERAKALGNDNQLSATSASDAAAAMTELAKGGFTVEQSMEAARGTLQLAAAAQIDAGTAATIQSQALQSFGLDASYAATAADVLANAANASSAEITDIAAGLGQSGAVANQFGLTIEDTAATLGVLSNAGIAGSDAGTLLKSALLSITDQGKPAQAAIEELGLTVYDAQGQFVGMSSLFGQLDTAAANMTPELYQAATATLFGSDAMRLAGVAAEQGQAGYDAMHTAIERQGAAAEVAAAKTQGLPGAMASVQNATETLTLGLYGLIQGPLETFATSAADKISSVTPGIISGLQDAGGAVVDFGQMLAPVAGFVGDAVGAFLDLPAPVQAVAAALAALQVTGGADKIGGFFKDITENFRDFREEMQGEIDMQAALSGIGEGENPLGALTGDADELAGALEENAEPLSELAAGLATLERRSPAVRNMAEGYRGVTARTREFANQQRAAASQSGALTSALRNGAARAATFGGAVGGTAVAGLRGMTSAAKGAIGVLGGPWMVGIMAATAIIGKISTEYAALDAQQEAIDKSTSDVAAAQRDVAKAFQESRGAMSDNVLGAVGMQIDSVRDKAKNLADNGPGAFGIFAAAGSDIKGWFSGVAEAGTDALHTQEDLAEQGAKTESGFRNLGKTNEEVAAALSGSDAEYNAIANSLRGIEDGGSEALGVLQPLRDEFVKARETAQNTTPGFFDLRDAVKVLSDESSSATDRINAMKTALDVLSGKPIPLSDALQTYNDQVRATAEVTNEVWDAAEGWGDALIKADGSVETSSSNGSKLRDSLLQIKDATITAADAGADLGPIWASNDAQLQQLSISTGVSVDALRRMIEAEGLVPKNIEMLASLRGADTAEQQLTILAGLLTGVGQPVDIPVGALTDEAKRKIIELGGTVERDINGKPGIVRITAPNEDALRRIRDVDLATQGIRDKTVTITVEERRSRMQFGMSDEAYANLVAQAPAGKATGGPITGGVPGKDSVPILAMPGEHMLTTEDVDRLGGQAGVYRFRDALARGEVRGYAGGGAIVDNLAEYVGQKFPALTMTSGLRPGDSGYHGQGMAADFSNGSGNTDAQLGLATLMASKFGSELKELIYDDPRFGREVKDGSFVDDSFYDGAGDHTNHVHIATDHPLTDAAAVDVAPLSERDQIAQAIIDEGKRRGISDNGIKAAVMAGLAESDLQNIPYGDRDSTGVFQQRDNGAWGTAEDRMDPTRAAGMFYDQLATFDYESMDPADAAQKVQQSAFSDGSNYREKAEEADSIIAGLGTSGTDASGTSSKWAEKDQIALDRAAVAVTQAEEARDKIYANEKKSQADRDQADLKVKAAKQKVVDLQAKKDGAAAGVKDGPAPQAPDLAKTYTDVEIERMEAQFAVDDANERRNEVYADSEATESDRGKADIALDQARKKLGEVVANPGSTLSKSGKTGEGFSLKGRLTEFGEQLVGIAVDALFEQMPFGLGDSRWWSLEVPSFGQSTAAMTPGQIDGSQPAPDWVSTLTNGITSVGTAMQTWDVDTRKDYQSQFADFINSKRKNAKLRDNGGDLEHGAMALNLSGSTEKILSSDQAVVYDRNMREVAAIRAGNAAAATAGAIDLTGFDSKISELVGAARQPAVTFQTDSVDQGIRAWRSEMNVRSMSFKKRR
ncbi:phage tail tape measure protein [Rhodococcus sp. 05-2256-B2]|uniref:phage tail tape measure protein n=1 Tax=unclassified Rhodococcus (in: high G+C Gram-positive bacteria) TaxID=192944 RepID=UPI000B9A72D1|nr:MULTISPECIES: phage tail tape measure protein [unclassified Rhodococcus (in: high G+C Gram-positive bacteria)]OZD81822.1 phage tail tape measure protein [Rhodococcus sp. 05-2256-B4]OZD90443.1 phage tail tape measure protein [Rhodococcus sp. 05-2256-B3]OZD96933.1 phage tail tape measure protein [Rhodococcus sp. 05-2256-B2]OZE00445.1 phage tail tape measure protein [Rhodococcus sp. 05-2256-B1]